MLFYERFEQLCSEKGIKPQNREIQEIAGVSSPAITGWKKGSLPKADTICRLAEYFHVTTDYLLGVSEVRSYVLPDDEKQLLTAYRSANAQGKFRIIQLCMNESDTNSCT